MMMRSTGGSSGPALPQIAHLVRRWSADAITPQTDNTAITTGWTDSVGGSNLPQATGAAQPKYRTNLLGGKPGVQLAGTQFFAGTDAALKAVTDSKTFTVYILADKITANTNGTLFGNSAGGNSFMFQANGALVGRFNAATTELRAPYADTVTPIGIGYTSSATKVYSSQSGTGLERSYLNGMCVTSNTSSFTALNYSADSSFAIGSLSSVGTASFCAKANVYEVLVWDRTLTEVEMAQVEIWVRNKYSLALPWASLPRMFHFDGDSLTVGVGTPSVATSYPYLNAQSLGLGYGQWAMHAVGGVTTQDMTGLAASPAKLNDWIGLLALTNIPPRLLAWEWYNEKNTGRVALAYTDMVAYCSLMRGFANLKLCLATSTGYTGDATDPYVAVRGAYNVLLDTNHGAMADAYVAIHADANIGDGSSFATNSATYWIGDGVHLNAAGRIVLAGLMLPGAQAINN